MGLHQPLEDVANRKNADITCGERAAVPAGRRQTAPGDAFCPDLDRFFGSGVHPRPVRSSFS